jgi:hypothetical protein
MRTKSLIQLPTMIGNGRRMSLGTMKPVRLSRKHLHVPNHPGKPTPTLAIRMADIQPEPVAWLWHPYIHSGSSQVLFGTEAGPCHDVT